MSLVREVDLHFAVVCQQVHRPTGEFASVVTKQQLRRSTFVLGSPSIGYASLTSAKPSLLVLSAAKTVFAGFGRKYGHHAFEFADINHINDSDACGQRSPRLYIDRP